MKEYLRLMACFISPPNMNFELFLEVGGREVKVDGG